MHADARGLRGLGRARAGAGCHLLVLLLGASTSASARPSGRTAASDVAPDGREPCDATRALRADRERCPAAGASVFLTEPVGFKLPRAE